MAGKPVGTAFAEISLDSTKLEQGLKRVNEQLVSGSIKVEDSYKSLGIKSDQVYNMMRANATAAVDFIKNKTLSSKEEIIRAETAAAAKIQALNEQQFGHQATMIEGLKANWLAASVAVYAAYSAMNKAWDILQHGAKEEQITEAFHNVARTYGQDADKIVEAMKKASGGTIEESALMQKAIKGMTQDLSGSDMIKIAEIARVAARTTGRDVSEMFDEISDAIANKLPKSLKKLGLVSKEELKILEDAIKAGVEGTTLLDLAFIQATKSGEAMGKMAKNDNEAFQQLKATGKDMYDAFTEGALKYFKALGKLGQGDMALGGFSPGGMGAGLQGDPKASEQAVSAEQRKKQIYDELKAKTAAVETAKNAAKNYAKETEELAKIEQDRFNNLVDMYGIELKMKEDATKAESDRVKEAMKDAEDEAKVEQDRFNNLVDMYGIELKLQDEVGKKTKDSFNGIKMAIEASSGALADFVVTGKMDFKSFADSIVRDFIRIQIQQSLLYGATGGKEGSTGWIGGALSIVSGLLGSAKGNAFDAGNVIPFARGGIINRPTIFPMARGMGLMGEAGPEAVMPLTRGSDGKLGVKARGGDGNGEGATIINIIANDAKSFEDMCRRNPAAITGPVLQSLRDNKTRTEFRRMVG